MNKFRIYLDETSNELMNKVSWPSWNELQESAIVVMVSSLLIAFVIYIMDKSLSEGLKLFYNMF